eukprot:jgi/Mesvir1/17475/Mv08750-RA.1
MVGMLLPTKDAGSAGGLKVMNKSKPAAAPAAAAASKPAGPGLMVVHKRAAPVEEVLPPCAFEVTDRSAEANHGRLERLFTGSKTVRQQRHAAQHVADYVKEGGEEALLAHDLLGTLLSACEGANNWPETEQAAGFYAISALASTAVTIVEPFLIPSILSTCLKAASSKSPEVRTAAADAAKSVLSHACPLDHPLVLPVLLAGCDVRSNKWVTVVAALAMVEAWAVRAPKEMAKSMPDVVPVLTECMTDTKGEIAAAGLGAMQEAFKTVNNVDIERFLPSLIHCIAHPATMPETIAQLASTTFLQPVKAPMLSVIVPLLLRGLREGKTVTRRQTFLIIDNMSRLVHDPIEAMVFLPQLLPALTKASSEIADPEAREVGERAHATLSAIEQRAPAAQAARAEQRAKLHTEETIRLYVETAVKEQQEKASPAEEGAPSNVKPLEGALLQFVTFLCHEMMLHDLFEMFEWMRYLQPYLLAVMSKEDSDAVIHTLLGRIRLESDLTSDDDEDEGVDLCNCRFSLAYGSLILLERAHLRLKRGRRYGLCGRNGVGKSTLMRAIANGQLEGFPSQHELRTVYVEHDIDASEAATAVVDFVFQDPVLARYGERPCRKEVETVLESVGFTDTMRQAAVSTLSGGWKMKLALARAMLMRADILLLDEPTNHLDTTNVAWLENYLTGLETVTSMIVSHDSGFLDNVCTDIIHYEPNQKLKRYKGNLSEFVKIVPEAKTYYELGAAQNMFKLPQPGYLEGVKGKNVGILRLQRVGYKYPGTERMVLTDVTVCCALGSRVGIIGANGAGKSTLVKLMTQSIDPTDGYVWQHPNARIAYVAQHAFHHIEEHLEKTPSEYLRWRYQTEEDREAMAKVNRQVTEEDLRRREQFASSYNGYKMVVEKLVGKRELRKVIQYEVKWVNLWEGSNQWIAKDKLEEMGYGKLVADYDAKESARSVAARPFTGPVITAFLADFGLNAEIANHTSIGSLSGGQKVKVVLAAAMWNCPHLLVLDEPTNYLDRDSLGALAAALKQFEGGVVMISHSAEFIQEICPELWTVADGKVTCTGMPFEYVPLTKFEKLEKHGSEDADKEKKAGVGVPKTRKKDMTRKEREAEAAAKAALKKAQAKAEREAAKEAEKLAAQEAAIKASQE